MKKYQIFISSTYEDLKDERNVVRDAILKLLSSWDGTIQCWGFGTMGSDKGGD